MAVLTPSTVDLSGGDVLYRVQGYSKGAKGWNSFLIHACGLGAALPLSWLTATINQVCHNSEYVGGRFFSLNGGFTSSWRIRFPSCTLLPLSA